MKSPSCRTSMDDHVRVRNRKNALGSAYCLLRCCSYLSALDHATRPRCLTLIPRLVARRKDGWKMMEKQQQQQQGLPATAHHPLTLSPH